MTELPDRTLAPEIKIPPYIPVRPPDFFTEVLPEGRKFMAWHNTTHPYIRIQFIYPFSPFNHPIRIVPDFCLKLIKDGTAKRTWQEIAEAFDFFGTSLSGSSTDQYTEFNIYYLHRFQPHILELLADVLTHAVFPEDQMERLRQKEILSFKTNLERVSFLSSRKLHELVYKNTPFERITELEDFQKITQSDILNFYKEYYLNGPSMIAVTGGEEKHALEILDFFKKVWNRKPGVPIEKINLNSEKGIFSVHKDNARQSSIRLAISVPYYDHPDYPFINVLCKLLGGYFGSRLNMNIREEKGYTYGVHGTFVKMMNQLQFRISTEVGTEYTHLTLEEIKKEIQRLAEADYPDEELRNLANYMAGLKLKRTNGIFENADAWINDYQKQIPEDYNKIMYDVFFEVKPHQLAEVARKWMRFENFTVVVAGDTNKFGK
jgi:predicted Zn-dependent peptidase